jgi:S-adenosylmethionine:tRNA ribosyltransferase-isomerase
LKVDLFDYNLPENLIAQYPVSPRDSSKLMVLKRDGQTQPAVFSDIVELIQPGSLLVFNNTKVIPARIYTEKATGGKVELLLTKGNGPKWKSIFKASRRPKTGEFLTILLPDGKKGPQIEVTHSGKEREISLKLPVESSPWEFLEEFGHVPLPPYIARADSSDDKINYQTLFAKKPGAVAAPTAGLHFTDEIMEKLEKRGIKTAQLTLHVGIGTFTPIKVDETDNHIMHKEQFEISSDLVNIIKNHPEDLPIIAVGTTSLRALEGAATGPRQLTAGSGETDIFITPGYKFKIIDSLITNFHLPRSTLLMLVSALRGRENILSAYEKAVELNFRFFSYGDAMFLP